ncbi:MAG TPA: metal-sensitive transcriptional regulator [Capsulimonadaceae bacterium]|jgi:DNA-binding FrmR family transcriptional regulator
MQTGEQKANTIKRLRRIEGQVRGVADMVENERYCVDVLTQIAAIHEALRGVGKGIIENHLATCVTEAAQTGSDEERSEKYRELVATIYKFVR